MMGYLEGRLRALRPVFTREATFSWFVVALAGVVTRQEVYGVSSIVRGPSLAPVYYPALLHFFHSTAWTAERLYQHWEDWLIRQPVVESAAGRVVLLGDHTKQPKDGRRMPGVTTLHQDSETSSKPSYFRGHHWGCLSLIGQAHGKRFASVKNLLGGLAYHFWSKYLAPVSRRPRRGSQPAPVSSRPDRTANTLAAIQKFMALHLIVLGTLQLMAALFGDDVRDQARCWLRTPSGAVPSDFVSRTALANLLLVNIRVLAKNPVVALIRRRQIAPERTAGKEVARKRRAA